MRYIILAYLIVSLLACTKKEDTQYEPVTPHYTNKTLDGFQISEICMNGVLYYSMYRTSMSPAFDKNSHVITCNN